MGIENNSHNFVKAQFFKLRFSCKIVNTNAENMSIEIEKLKNYKS